MQDSHTASSRTSSYYGQAMLNVAKAPRWRSLLLTFLLLLVACWTWRSSQGAIPHTHLPSWNRVVKTNNPEYDDLTRPATLQLSNLTHDLESGDYENVPSQLKKENPQFHLLVHAPKINTGVCRCLLSSYILNYPPPTLIGYQPPDQSLSHETLSNENATMEKDQNGIPDVSDYLRNQPKIKDNDAVLVVDGEFTLFQLPSEVLLSSLAKEDRLRNQDLASRYPPINVNSHSGPLAVQRFNQSIFFASSKSDVPSPLNQLKEAKPAIDLFGYPAQQTVTKSDTQAHEINDAFIIGTARPLRRLFQAASTANNQIIRSDAATFRTLYAQQERVRAGIFHSQRHRRSLWRIWKLWLSFRWGVDRAVRWEQEKEERAAALRDSGIGLDEQSKMVVTVGEDDMQAAAVGTATGSQERRDESGVRVVESANASGVDVPDVLMEKGARGPFAMHPSHLHPNLTTPSDMPTSRRSRGRSTTDNDEHYANDEGVFEEELPSEDTDWASIPLLLDSESSSIPAVLTGASVDTYEKIWFKPYARTLLNQYLLRSLSKEIASEAAVGGERWWDSRGGRGGVWTTEGEWLDAGELCAPFAGDLFVDGGKNWGGWAEVDEDEEDKEEEATVTTVVVVTLGSGDATSTTTSTSVSSTLEAESTSLSVSEASPALAETTPTQIPVPANQSGPVVYTSSSMPTPSHISLTSLPTPSQPSSQDQENSNENEQNDEESQIQNDEESQVENDEESQVENDDEEQNVPLAIMPDGTVKALSDFAPDSA